MGVTASDRQHRLHGPIVDHFDDSDTVFDVVVDVPREQ